MARALVPLAPGCEEIEAVTIIDVLRRGGVEVIAAGLHPGAFIASRGVQLVPDCDLADVCDDDYDAVILPGGKGGTDALQSDDRIHQLIKRQHEQGKCLAAICAAPSVLASLGVLNGRDATSYPGSLDGAQRQDIRICDERIVQDGHIITSQGPGTAMEFAVFLVGLLVSQEKAYELKIQLIMAD